MSIALSVLATITVAAQFLDGIRRHRPTQRADVGICALDVGREIPKPAPMSASKFRLMTPGRVDHSDRRVAGAGAEQRLVVDRARR